MTTTPPTPDEVRRTLALGLVDLHEQLGPIYDTADGIRAELNRRGWSPTAAEAAALTWLQGALGFMWIQAAQNPPTPNEEKRS